MNDRDIRKLTNISNLLVELVEEVVSHSLDYSTYMHDRLLRRGIVALLNNIGEHGGQLSDEARQEIMSPDFWASFKGFRNLSSHDYGNVDFDIAWSILTEDMPELSESLKASGFEAPDCRVLEQLAGTRSDVAGSVGTAGNNKGSIFEALKG